MKTKLIIATLGLASVLSFGASAAVQQVNTEQAQNLQSMGTLSAATVVLIFMIFTSSNFLVGSLFRDPHHKIKYTLISVYLIL